MRYEYRQLRASFEGPASSQRSLSNERTADGERHKGSAVRECTFNRAPRLSLATPADENSPPPVQLTS